MIVRAHSSETEEAVARLSQLPEDRPRPPTARPDIISPTATSDDQDMLDLLSMSKLVLDHHAKVTRTKYKGIHDPRLRAREFSVGAWMVRLAGLATDEGPEFQGLPVRTSIGLSGTA
jgi:hypothetical protein